MKIIYGSLKWMFLAFACVFGLVALVFIALGPSLIAGYVESRGASKGWVLFTAAWNFPWLGFLMYLAEGAIPKYEK